MRRRAAAGLHCVWPTLRSAGALYKALRLGCQPGATGSQEPAQIFKPSSTRSRHSHVACGPRRLGLEWGRSMAEGSALNAGHGNAQCSRGGSTLRATVANWLFRSLPAPRALPGPAPSTIRPPCAYLRAGRGAGRGRVRPCWQERGRVLLNFIPNLAERPAGGLGEPSRPHFAMAISCQGPPQSLCPVLFENTAGPGRASPGIGKTRRAVHYWPQIERAGWKIEMAAPAAPAVAAPSLALCARPPRTWP